jgi:tryptophanyl-tRNA synthetase
VIDAVLDEQRPMLERVEAYVREPERLNRIIEEGQVRARAIANETMRDVRGVMGLGG